MKKAALLNAASKLKAVADPMRLRILESLLTSPSCVTALSESLNAEIFTISRHLQILKRAGIVEIEREGKKIIYSLARKATAEKAGLLKLGRCSLDLRPS